MNLDRYLHGRLTINGNRIKLGHATLPVLIQRLAEQYRGHKSTSTKINCVFEFSADPIPDSSLLDRESQLLNEMSALTVEDNEEIFPGVTAARIAEVMQTHEYVAYAAIAQNPDKRPGLNQDRIQEVKAAYFEKFPDCCEHFPLWVES